MKRCPECGGIEFNAYQVRRYWVVVTGDKFPQWERDSESPDNPYDCSAPEGDFECTNCGAFYTNWEDIPDAD